MARQKTRRWVELGRFVLLAAACSGCSNDYEAVTHDLGVTSDLRVPDLSSAPDAAAQPLGHRIVAGMYEVGAITTDDFVAAAKAGKGVEAVSLTSGMEMPITPYIGMAIAREKAIFAWKGVLPNDGQFASYDLTTWTAVTGAVHQSSNSIVNLGRASADGAFVFFADNTAPDETTTDLVVSRSDGGGPFRFARSARLSDTCIPNGRFVQDRLVVNFCPEATDGGASGHAIVVVDPLAASVDVLMKANAAFQPFWVDEKSGAVLAAEENGKGWLFSLFGGPAVYVDADVQDGLLLPDGSSVVYRTSKGALKRVQLGMNTSPVTLVASGVMSLFLPQDLPYWMQLIGANAMFPGVSPDGKKIIFATQVDVGTGFTDLWLASTESPAPPIPLVTTPTGFLVGRPFTEDSNRVFYRSNCTWVPKEFIFFGSLESRDVRGMDLRTLASRSVLLWPGRNSTIAYGDNFHEGAGHGTADILIANDAMPGPPTFVASQVASDFAMNPSMTKIVFTVDNSSENGIYVYDLP